MPADLEPCGGLQVLGIGLDEPTRCALPGSFSIDGTLSLEQRPEPASPAVTECDEESAMWRRLSKREYIMRGAIDNEVWGNTSKLLRRGGP